MTSISQNIAIIDNGAHRIKYGWAGDEAPEGSMPNCIAKINKTMQVFVGDDIDSIANTSQLQLSRPCDRGFLVNWNTERDVNMNYFCYCNF
jgi:actin-related protein 6